MARRAPGAQDVVVSITDITLNAKEYHLGDLRKETRLSTRFYLGGTTAGAGLAMPHLGETTAAIRATLVPGPHRLGHAVIGVVVFAESVNNSGQKCVKLICSRSFDAHRLFADRGAGVPFEGRLYLYPFAREVGFEACERGSIAFTARCVSVSPHMVVARPERLTSMRGLSSLNEFVDRCYISAMYKCAGLVSRPTVPKIAPYFVPYFDTVSGAVLPASAYLRYSAHHQYTHIDKATPRPVVDDLVRTLYACVNASVACYPEILSVHRAAQIWESLSGQSRPERLGTEEYAALRAAFEVLVQKPVSEPYLLDGDVEPGSMQLRPDDVFVPIGETISSDCEDDHTGAYALLRLVQRTDWRLVLSKCSAHLRPHAEDLATGLAPLYRMFTGFIAIMYCGDDNPEQQQADDGLCHVSLIVMPNAAADSFAAGCTATRWWGVSTRRWEDACGLVIPEGTALTDPLAYPLPEALQAERGRRYAAEKAFSDLTRDVRRASGPQVELHFSGVLSRRKPGGGHYISGFYQWITNIWTYDYVDSRGVDVMDFAPCYRSSAGLPQSWGIRVDDLSAACCIRGLGTERVAAEFGRQAAVVAASSSLCFVPRVSSDAARMCVPLCDKIIATQLPPYRIFPMPNGTYKGSVLGNASLVHSMLDKHAGALCRAAMRERPSSHAHHIRASAYACDMDESSWGERGAAMVMDILEAALSPGGRSGVAFHALRIVVHDPFYGRACTKVSFLLYYRPSSGIRPLKHSPSAGPSSSRRADRTRGRFSGASSSSAS